MLDHNTVVRCAYQLEPLPPSCSRLSALVVQELPDLAEIIEVISYDSVLTVKLLRAANSAASSPMRTIGTVKEAVVRLGTGAVFNLAISSFARPVMKRAVSENTLSCGDMWKHSVAAGLAAEAAKNFCTVPWSPLFFTAALLHDIGKLVLGRFVTPELLALCRRAVEDGGLEPYQAESEVLSTHHGEVGGVIAQHWQLPLQIMTGILYHHTPEEGQETSGFVTHLANAVAKQIEGNPVSTESGQRALANTRQQLGLTHAGFDKLCEITSQRLREVGDRFG